MVRTYSVQMVEICTLDDSGIVVTSRYWYFSLPFFFCHMTRAWGEVSYKHCGVFEEGQQRKKHPASKVW